MLYSEISRENTPGQAAVQLSDQQQEEACNELHTTEHSSVLISSAITAAKPEEKNWYTAVSEALVLSLHHLHADHTGQSGASVKLSTSNILTTLLCALCALFPLTNP